LDGISQARAFTYTTSSGGKDPGAAGSRQILEGWEALLKEALAPHADDLSAGAQPVCDFLVGKALVRQEDHLCPNNLIIR
jgi:hypothetical protein